MSHQRHADVASPEPMKLTPEQDAILSHDPRESLVVDAFAGTGKTSVLVKFAEKWPQRGLYLAFNSAIAQEARGRFPSNVTARTAHSFAFHRLDVAQYKDRLLPGKLMRKHIREAGFNLNSVHLTNEQMIKAVMTGLTNFMIDAGEVLTPLHCGIAHLPSHIQEAVIPAIGRIVHKFVHFQTSGLPFTHDIYLKHLELKGGLGEDFDYLLVDEAQDLNPVLISLVRKSGLPSIVVGDPYQSIYAFRGAVSAMQAFDAEHLPLTQSWRFGGRVAAIANHILSFSTLAPERPVLGRPGRDTKVERYTGRVSGRSFILSRTNARLFEGLIGLIETKTPFHIAGGFETMASQILSAWALANGRMEEVRDPFVRNFPVWGALVEEAEDGDPDAKRLNNIISDHGSAIPQIIEQLRSMHCPHSRDAKIILSTAHKAKGLEADNVVMLEDFETPRDIREKYIDQKISKVAYDQELNLLYVSVTRAKQNLFLSDRLFDAFQPHIAKYNASL